MAACLDCGLDYYRDFPLDVLLPRAQWLLIHPADHGVLCAACIVKRAAKIPGARLAHLVIEFAPRDNVEAELLAALKDMLPYVESCIERRDCPASKDTARIRAAIAKAEGR